MARLFMEGGFVMLPILLIVLILFGLTLRTLWELVVRQGSNTALVQNGLDGLLFWGGFAVVLGLLGSVIGYNKSMSAVVARGVANPRFIWLGTAEGLVSTITGLLVLALAGLVWFALRWGFLRSRHITR
jgi:biopolymer transport protein ExbB/TolQ